VQDRFGPIPRAGLVLTPFAIIYLLGAAVLRVPLARGLVDRLHKSA
jgi:hypothetical protein